MKPNELSEFLASRHSTRDFLPKPVPQSVIDEIIADGLTSPSWSNTRPIVVAVAAGEVRDRISAEFMARWEIVAPIRSSKWGQFKLLFTRRGLPTSNPIISKPYVPELLSRAQRIGAAMFSHMGIDRKDRVARDAAWARNYEFFGAPIELFIFTHTSLGKFSANDAGLFVMNLMLGAHARGLGTCAQGALGIYDDIVRDEFEVPDSYELLYGIALGYPSDSVANTFAAPRFKPSDITLLPKQR
jgi:nitroreductase